MEDDLQRFYRQPLRFQYLYGVEGLSTGTDDIVQMSVHIENVSEIVTPSVFISFILTIPISVGGGLIYEEVFDLGFRKRFILISTR